MAIKIGLNANIFANRNAADQFFGQKIASLKRSIREARDAKLLLDQLSDDDLLKMSYAAEEITILRGAMNDAEDLFFMFTARPIKRDIPSDFDQSMKFLAAVV